MGIKTGNRKIETGELKYTRHADQLQFIHLKKCQKSLWIFGKIILVIQFSLFLEF